MNEVIKALYEIEEQAGDLMEEANASRQEIEEKKRRQMEEICAEMEAEMEGRITILRSRLEEQAQEEIQKLEEKNRQKAARFNELYQKNLHQYARKIIERITEV